ncbi:hypothetical protein PR202_gb08143 [Eleusine coracana subsp. coracana]|uniref:Uncharacterized protein n=1 Tax=Eleusine coracana subsp. coracana TaxID=191504 RepID=A0AAV5EE59_ELECO|nr:hypothetical protein PR202_gb08143 [Eleusine coracana subsp. coracana]
MWPGGSGTASIEPMFGGMGMWPGGSGMASMGPMPRSSGTAALDMGPGMSRTTNMGMWPGGSGMATVGGWSGGRSSGSGFLEWWPAIAAATLRPNFFPSNLGAASVFPRPSTTSGNNTDTSGVPVHAPSARRGGGRRGGGQGRAG